MGRSRKRREFTRDGKAEAARDAARIASVALWGVYRGVGHAIRTPPPAGPIAFCGRQYFGPNASRRAAPFVRDPPKRICEECARLIGDPVGPEPVATDVPTIQGSLAFGD